MNTIDTIAALIVIDVQEGFDDPSWGRTNNPSCEANVERLTAAWAATGRPVVVVRHDSPKPASPLNPGHPGNALKPSVAALDPALLVTKSVNSAFYGEPDLDQWLRERDADTLVVVGIQTNMCVETTARMAGNLGYRVVVPLDATRTFDLTGPAGPDGTPLTATAEELARATAVSLHGGGFATVTTTDEVLAALR